MGFLDRFKTQPRWKHPDPDVRLAGVREIPDEEEELIVSIAREDADPRVRKEAVARLLDVTALIDIAHGDRDEAVRDEATRILLDVACGTIESADASTPARALEGLADPRHVTTVAKSSSLEPVAVAALARVHDAKALAGLARQASHASVRLEAVARVADPAELINIAARTDHKDVGLAALERIDDQEAFQMLASRAKNKAVARKAKTMLRTTEDAPTPPGPQALEAQPHDQRRALCETVESLLQSNPRSVVPSALAQAEAQWSGLGDLTPDEADLAARFATACQTIRDRCAEHDRELADERRRAEEIQRLAGERVALCERVDALSGEDAIDRLPEIRTEWLALPELADEYGAPLAQRFGRACAAAEERHQAARARAARAADAVRLVEEAERVAAAAELEEARTRWPGLREEWGRVRAAVDDTLAARFDQAEAHLTAREAQAREQRDKAQRENLTRLQAKCAHLERLANAPTLSLKEGERALRDLRLLLDRAGPLPSKSDADEVARRLKAAQSALYPRVQELREADEWQRWANAGLQEDLCRRAEALAALEDMPEVAKQVRELQAQWKAVGAAPRDRAEALWTRFRIACDGARARCDTYFAAQLSERTENFRRKEALCQQADTLADSTDWLRTAEALKRLQAEWKTIGSGLHEKATWERFRGACDRFFTRRKEDLERRKHDWAANLRRKEALCGQAEALSESADWEVTLAEMRRLQAEWKTIGPVQRNKSEAIWARFMGACNRFFERYQHRDKIALASQLAEREALCRELESLVPGPGAAAAPDPIVGLGARVRELRKGWQQASALPRDQAHYFNTRFETALIRVAEAHPSIFVGTDLDVDANRRQMETLCATVERFLATAMPGGASPAATLATQLREALAANTIGGRVDEDVKWRAAVEDVKAAQAAWKRIGPVPKDLGNRLTQRFQIACTRFFDQRRRSSPETHSSRR